MVAHFLFYDFQVKVNNHAKLKLHVARLLSPLPFFIGLASPKISESLPCSYPKTRLLQTEWKCLSIGMEIFQWKCSKVNLFDFSI